MCSVILGIQLNGTISVHFSKTEIVSNIIFKLYIIQQIDRESETIMYILETFYQCQNKPLKEIMLLILCSR